MILTGQEIRKQVESGHIHIVPFELPQINSNSYDYRLHEELLEILDETIDPKSAPKTKKILLTEEGYTLQPGKLYLGSTYEEIGSNHYVTSLIGRSSLGRLGLFLQITADLGNLGSKHRWTLELKVVQPLTIYPMMKIGQVTFWNIEGEQDQLYQGKYANFKAAHPSEIYKEFQT